MNLFFKLHSKDFSTTVFLEFVLCLMTYFKAVTLREEKIPLGYSELPVKDPNNFPVLYISNKSGAKVDNAVVQSSKPLFLFFYFLTTK